MSWGSSILGVRRNVIAAFVTASAAVALAVTISGRGCGSGDGSPEGAARAFITAARAADKKAVWELLGPQTRARLESAARDATDRAGGVERYQPLDMLGLRPIEGGFVPVHVTVSARSERTAQVEIVAPDLRQDTLSMVKVGTRWRVELETD